MITARLFDVSDFAACGLTSNAFKGKPVNIKFIGQLFNGNMQLVLTSIEVFTGEFDFARFIGKIECDTSSIIQVGKNCFGAHWELPAGYTYFSCDQIGKGRVGAFLKVFDLALATLVAYCDIDTIDEKELFTTLFCSMDEYYNLLRNKQTYADISSILVYDSIAKISAKYDHLNEKLLIVDTVRALVGFDKPIGLIPKLICSAVKSASANLNLIFAYNVLPVGASTNIGGEILSKY